MGKFQEALKNKGAKEKALEDIINLGGSKIASGGVEGDVTQAEEKFYKQIIKEADIINNLPTLISMAKDYISHEYTAIPAKTIAAVCGAIAYFVSPIDLLPDWLPMGYIDDAGVVALVVTAFNSDINAYKTWRAERNADVEDGASRLTHYLDLVIGNNEERRTEEIQRLAKMCDDADGSLTLEERAVKTLDLLDV